LRQQAAAFDFALLHFALRDKGAGALLRLEHSPNFELTIGAHHGIGVDGEVYGHLADGRDLIAHGQLARRHTAEDLIDDLAIDGNTAMEVEAEGEGFCFRHLYI
jgi:hypothetical protein